jgi:hypothetical protein
MKTMTIIYVKWKDAVHSMDEHAIVELGALAELEEIGFLIKETPESIVIGTENQDGALHVRMWLTIPRVNIVEQKRTTLARAFPKPRVKKARKHESTKDVKPEILKDVKPE